MLSHYYGHNLLHSSALQDVFMNHSATQTFWNEIGSTKNFSDPFFEAIFSQYVEKTSAIIEYGCGYGRILSKLWEAGYTNLQGFDFAPKMIERGQTTFPHLNLNLLNETGKVALADQSIHGAILSTVLCCTPNKEDQKIIMTELYRLLKGGGIIYLCDFLITPSEKYMPRYSEYAQPQDENYGLYRTNEGVIVRHHSSDWIHSLVEQFDIQWLEQLDDVTMNGNPVRTVHLIAQKL